MWLAFTSDTARRAFDFNAVLPNAPEALMKYSGIRDELIPQRGAVLSILEDHGVLFHERQQQIYQLDPLATLVWHSLFANGAPYEEVVAWFADKAGCSGEDATRFVAACIAGWQANDFVTSKAQEKSEAEFCCAQAKSAATVVATATATDADVFRVAGAHISVGYPDEAVADAVRAVIGHLNVASGTVRDFAFKIERHADGYAFTSASGIGQKLIDAEAVAVDFKNEVLGAILSARPNSIALHAAALHAPTGAVMLAGSSGHGKTTLAALLNAYGWPSIADDVVLLESDSSRIQGLALAYAVKPGSWSVLQGSFPGLDQRHPRLRPDGRTVRYIAPYSVADIAGGLPVSTVVFPRYVSGLGLTSRQGSKTTALVDLLRESINGGHYLSTGGFLGMCKLVEQAEVLELEYGCAAEAAEFLGETVGEGAKYSRSDGPL